MSKQTLNRLLMLLLVLSMLFTMTACKNNEDVDPDDANTSSSEPGEEEDDEPVGTLPDGVDPVDPPTLAEKITAGVARNKDTVGWLQIPNTTIDDAVLQYTNNEYYLRLDEDKRYDVFGCYYMDFESTPQTTRDRLAKNNIIYGHSDLRDNPDGLKFSQLYKYTDIDFVRQNPYIFYSTVEEEMTWQVFAVFYTNITFQYHTVNMDNTTFLSIVDEAKQKSEYIIDVPVTSSDKIITLSTCTANFVPGDTDNYRLVVMAKLLPESAVLGPTMEVEKNPSPKR